MAFAADFNFIKNRLIGRGNGEERVIWKPKDDDSDPTVKIHFKETEELEYWSPVDKLGSSVRPALEGDKTMKKRNEFVDPSGKKEIPLQNGIGTKKSIIPVTNGAGQNEKKKKKAANEFPTEEPTLTGLELNINEVSENFIEKTKRKMTEQS